VNLGTPARASGRVIFSFLQFSRPEMGLSRDRAAKLEERLDFETSGAPATVHENPGERCTPGRTHNRIKPQAFFQTADRRVEVSLNCFAY